MNPVRKDISFPFHPYDFKSGNHTVIKDDAKGKRRYLRGISSGINLDAHEERMTEKAVMSFMNQANSGDILLYPDIHGIKASEDIGILVAGNRVENGDWFTEYRLYDEGDGIGQVKLEKISDIWKQLRGEAPYSKPRQKGFSIEGYIPEGAILEAEDDGHGGLRKRVIDDVQLDGVVLVPRQAYKAGIANAVYKALGELPPWRADKLQKDIRGELQKIIDERETCNEYHRRRWDIDDARDKAIEKIMQAKDVDKQRQLEIVFDEYAKIIIPLIIQSESIFQKDDEDDDNIIQPYGEIGKASKLDLFKTLYVELEKLSKSIAR